MRGGGLGGTGSRGARRNPCLPSLGKRGAIGGVEGDGLNTGDSRTIGCNIDMDMGEIRRPAGCYIG